MMSKTFTGKPFWQALAVSLISTGDARPAGRGAAIDWEWDADHFIALGSDLAHLLFSGRGAISNSWMRSLGPRKSRAWTTTS